MTRFKHYVGRASAATLGYINYNVPGAYLGYKAYKAYEKLSKKRRMVRLRSGRSTSRSFSRGRSATRSSSSRSRSSMSRPKTGHVTSRYGTMAGSTFDPGSNKTAVSRGASKGAVVAKGGKKLKKYKGGPKVSRKFRKKVLQAVKDVEPSGHHRELYTDKMEVAPNINRQNTVRFPSGSNPNTGGMLFSMHQLLNSVSRLYNRKNKTPDPNINDAQNLQGGINDDDAGRNLIVDVTYQRVMFTMVNQSQRSCQVRLYTFQSKQFQSSNADDDPLSRWNDLITNNKTDNWGRAIVDDSDYAYGTTALYSTPADMKEFSKWYKYSYCDYVLEPGQTVQHMSYGECGRYDLAKHFEDTTYQPIHKKARFFILSVIPDVVMWTEGETPLNKIGRANADSNGNKEAICVETLVDTKFKLPEQIGFLTPGSFTGNSNQSMNKRVHRFCFDNYADGTNADGHAIFNVNAVNPTLTSDSNN